MNFESDIAEINCGFVALVGRPNVGKSTLLNRLIGQKISIVSQRPQTTRHRILGIHHRDDAQIIYVDTPGLHSKTPKAMNRYLNRAAATVLEDVDVVAFVVEGIRWTPDDEFVLEKLKRLDTPVILVINKIDKVRDKSLLLPHIASLSEKYAFADVIPVSAAKGTQLDALEEAFKSLLPMSPPLFPDEQVTDRSERFMAAELVREQLMRTLGQEVPYATTVEIEAFEREGRLLKVAALIWVERSGQKTIVIGRQGQVLKRVGKSAREAMEGLFDCRVYLQLWVKVREGWSDDERALQSLGYFEE
ncbi:GTPase Era [Alkalilimnicola ehrlichii]|uniref:GTPase Era n=1 Tax=Alkalilimnicola ehrlichii TaxID=351052 RepID=A0A3E0WZS0_9GAMM|nr:GTPase Era [Alkalilimnicola ehrlichii]RFA28347.1 GTPase Era [Alkalilimnicola ehrlichii]RFA38589.1 GTPase Era [Alkalilimnicola ehrlichii]